MPRSRRASGAGVAGIRIPDSTIAREATQLVADTFTELLYNQSRRVFLWGALYAQKQDVAYDAELFYVGAMFHDIGLTDGHRSAHERFEIDGANAARDFLERHGLDEDRVATVWDAIALHTTPQIPFYKRPEVWLVRWGVEYDIPALHFDELTAPERDAVTAAHPRVGFAHGIVEAFAAGTRDKPEVAFAPFLTDVLEEKLPGYTRPNFCDRLRLSPFDD